MHQLSRHDLMRKVLLAAAVVVLAFTVRSLTGNFIREHFDDAGWFQYGSYAVFDRVAQDTLDGKTPLFWIDDPTRTDRIVYPPGFPWWMATIYGLTGDRSPGAVQQVQIVLDSLSVLLIIGLGVSAFGWRVGLSAGLLGALSPLLALSGATPTADAPTSWLVIAAAWCLLLAYRSGRIAPAAAAGALLGLACWFRVNPLFLFPVWGSALACFVKGGWKYRFALGGTVAISAIVVISPLVIRNVTVFYPEIAPTGLGLGWNLLAGIGETERGEEFGAPCCDADIVKQERDALNIPDDVRFELNYPDGIRRDRERGRRAIAIIAGHPLWFTRVAAYRIWGHLKYSGTPLRSVGTAGINVTPSKTLGPDDRRGIVAAGVTVLGMVQSVWRYLALPLMLIGLFAAFREHRVAALILMSTVVYYLVTLAVGHSEIRYGLPMQAILIVFAAVGVDLLAKMAAGRTLRPAGQH
jgi:hypothetical protein